MASNFFAQDFTSSLIEDETVFYELENILKMFKNAFTFDKSLEDYNGWGQTEFWNKKVDVYVASFIKYEPKYFVGTDRNSYIRIALQSHVVDAFDSNIPVSYYV